MSPGDLRCESAARGAECAGCGGIRSRLARVIYQEETTSLSKDADLTAGGGATGGCTRNVPTLEKQSVQMSCNCGDFGV